MACSDENTKNTVAMYSLRSRAGNMSTSRMAQWHAFGRHVACTRGTEHHKLNDGGQSNAHITSRWQCVQGNKHKDTMRLTRWELSDVTVLTVTVVINLQCICYSAYGSNTAIDAAARSGKHTGFNRSDTDRWSDHTRGINIRLCFLCVLRALE